MCQNRVFDVGCTAHCHWISPAAWCQNRVFDLGCTAHCHSISPAALCLTTVHLSACESTSPRLWPTTHGLFLTLNPKPLATTHGLQAVFLTLNPKPQTLSHNSWTSGRFPDDFFPAQVCSRRRLATRRRTDLFLPSKSTMTSSDDGLARIGSSGTVSRGRGRETLEWCRGEGLRCRQKAVRAPEQS